MRTLPIDCHSDIAMILVSFVSSVQVTVLGRLIALQRSAVSVPGSSFTGWVLVTTL